jgi:tetratricopeptide (TPR) repeat protein
MNMMGEQVRYWFELAVNLPAKSRVAFLESDCEDPAVRSEVISLLKYDAGDTVTALDPSAPDVIRQTIGAALNNGFTPFNVQRVGPFELGRLLGSGGMGLVYEAHRVDGEVRQRVAIKFAQVSPLATREFRENAHRRFLRERQVLASLRHPYIAGLIDAGATPDGIPYAVIEQIDGIPIDSYCDASVPDKAERIQLVLKLCDAVQFAHQNLIVHSDIKPDNVLVTADGIPKLIDFGVARDLGQEATLNTMRAFTPGYASPELSQGATPTVATDVYGLGAVLYRLLTGEKPRQVESASFQELIRHITEEDVIRPSLVKQDLKGDLENILLKALQREPKRRYGSVPELADDLNRFLERRPVRATPDSAAYRAKRFARRHWAPLLTVAAFIIALSAVAIIAIKQRQDAVRRAQQTRQIATKLVFEVHDQIAGLLGATKARERVGAIAVQYLESIERNYGRDPEFAWELLNAYSRLAQSRGGAASSIGDTIGGLQFANKALQLGEIVEAGFPDNDRLDGLFQAYRGLLWVFAEAGRPDLRYETVTRMLRLAPRLQPLRVAQARNDQGRYLDSNGSLLEAAKAFEESLQVLRPLASNSSKTLEIDEQLTSTLVNLGRVQALTGNFSNAVSNLQEATRRSETMSSADPQIARTARALYWSHIVLGDVFGSPARFNLGRQKEAVEQYQAARMIAEKLQNADYDNDVAKLDLARALSREGMSLVESQPRRALALLEDSYLVLSKTSARNHAALSARFDYLTSSVEPLVKIGRIDRARSQISEARTLLRVFQRTGVEVNARNLLKAEEIELYATGDLNGALLKAQEHLSLLPQKTSAVLEQNFETVEVLERMRTYGQAVDVGVCNSATKRLMRTWEELHQIYPQSPFVLAQFERSQKLKSCVTN